MDTVPSILKEVREKLYALDRLLVAFWGGEERLSPPADVQSNLLGQALCEDWLQIADDAKRRLWALDQATYAGWLEADLALLQGVADEAGQIEVKEWDRFGRPIDEPLMRLQRLANQIAYRLRQDEEAWAARPTIKEPSGGAESVVSRDPNGKQRAILEHLATNGRTLKGALAGALVQDDATVKTNVEFLRVAKMVYYPQGKNGGVALTDCGRQWLAGYRPEKPVNTTQPTRVKAHRDSI